MKESSIDYKVNEPMNSEQWLNWYNYVDYDSDILNCMVWNVYIEQSYFILLTMLNATVLRFIDNTEMKLTENYNGQ